MESFPDQPQKIEEFDRMVRGRFLEAIEAGEDHDAATLRIKTETRGQWLRLFTGIDPDILPFPQTPDEPPRAA